MGKTKETTLMGRLMERTQKSPEPGCWLWMGCTNGKMRYGSMSIRNRPTLTHRLSYELHCGPIPEGMSVLHTCDTPRCVNPKHLFLGTNADNIADKVAKGRAQPGPGGPGGARHWNAKLTEADIRSIRASSERTVVLAARYGVQDGHIHKIRTRQVWAHLP